MSNEVSISVREFDDQVAAAYARLFGADRLSSLELDWRFRCNPHGPAKFVLALTDDGPAGMIALVATRLVGSRGERLGYQAIDTVVHPDWRGRGLFVKMGSAVQDVGAIGGDVLWGFPNANAAPGWFGRLGWRDYGAAPLLMKPLRSSFVLGRLHRRLSRIDFRLVRRGSTGASHSEQTLDEGFDELWARIRNDYGVAVDRSSTWMRWRLLENPGEQYRIRVHRTAAGELDAFLVSKVVDKHDARICYLMEALSLPASRNALGSMIRDELAWAASEGAQAALAWCPREAPNYAAFRKAGFFPVPPLLRPVEINFGAKALRDSAAESVADGKSWYVSFLDSDTN